MISKVHIAALATGLALGLPGAAMADLYDTASFTIATNPGNANVKAPFVGPLSQGTSYSGQLVFDQNLVPAGGSGFVNVFFSSFPDIAMIPPATALSFQLGSLPAFTLAGAQVQGGFQEAAIQYNNGHFAGLFYISDFTFQNNPYELQIQGAVWDIVAIVNGFPTFQNLVSGYIVNSLGNVQPYTPPTGTVSVPEPAGLAALASGLLALGLFRRRRA